MKTRFLTLPAATLALALAAMLGLAMSAAPAHAGNWDYLLPAPGVCGAAESDAGAPKQDQVRAGLCLTNATRQNYGRRRLGPENTPRKDNPSLNIAAGFKARDIMNCYHWANPHYACGRAMGYWLQKYRYHNPGAGSCPNGYWAENIYHGWGHPGNTVRAAVKWWVNSDAGHRDALLNPSYTQHSINRWGPGTYRGNANTIVWVQYLCR